MGTLVVVVVMLAGLYKMIHDFPVSLAVVILLFAFAIVGVRFKMPQGIIGLLTDLRRLLQIEDRPSGQPEKKSSEKSGVG